MKGNLEYFHRILKNVNTWWPLCYFLVLIAAKICCRYLVAISYLTLHQANSAEMSAKLAKLGLAAVLAYGLFDGVTYTTFFILAFLGYEKSTGKNPAANLQALLGVSKVCCYKWVSYIGYYLSMLGLTRFLSDFSVSVMPIGFLSSMSWFGLETDLTTSKQYV